MPSKDTPQNPYPVRRDWSRAETEKALWCASTGLAERYLYFSYVLQQAQCHVVDDDAGIPVAACSLSAAGLFHIFVNRRVFCSLTPLHQIFVLRHEVGHLAQGSHHRMRGLNPELYNQASDMVINDEILAETELDETLSTDGYFWHETALLPKHINMERGRTAEEYYQALVRRSIPLPVLKAARATDGWAHGHFLDPDRLLPGQVKALNDSLHAGDSLVGHHDEAAERILKRALFEWRQSGGRGTEPGSVAAMLTGPVPGSEYPFEYTLRHFLGRYLRGPSRPTWRRLSRRLPEVCRGRQRPRNHPCFYLVVDTSGSMSDSMLHTIYGHIVRIAERCQAACRVIECDAQVQAVYPFEGSIDRDRFQVRGRGGTELQPALDHIAAEPDSQWRRPACTLIFTDGLFEPDLQPPGYPVLFVGPSEDILHDRGVFWGQRLDVDLCA